MSLIEAVLDLDSASSVVSSDIGDAQTVVSVSTEQQEELVTSMQKRTGTRL